MTGSDYVRKRVVTSLVKATSYEVATLFSPTWETTEFQDNNFTLTTAFLSCDITTGKRRQSCVRTEEHSSVSTAFTRRARRAVTWKPVELWSSFDEHRKFENNKIDDGTVGRWVLRDVLFMLHCFYTIIHNSIHLNSI